MAAERRTRVHETAVGIASTTPRSPAKVIVSTAEPMA